MSPPVDVRIGRDRAWGRWVTSGRMRAGESRMAGAVMIDGEAGTWHASHLRGDVDLTLTMIVRRSPCSSSHQCHPDASESGIAGYIEDALRQQLLRLRRTVGP